MLVTDLGKHVDIHADTMHTYVRYMATEIVTFNERFITLDSGKMQSLTTKKRMNQVSQMFCLGFKVISKRDGSWHVWYDGETQPFVDNLILMR